MKKVHDKKAGCTTISMEIGQVTTGTVNRQKGKDCQQRCQRPYSPITF